jgi:hypothetical protein
VLLLTAVDVVALPFGKSKVKGQIVFRSGRELEGYLVLPKASEKSVIYYDSNEQLRKAAADDIRYLTVWNENAGPDYAHTFCFTEYHRYGIVKGDDSKVLEKCWLYMAYWNDNIRLFKSASEYQLNKDGSILLLPPESGDTHSSMWYLAQRTGEIMPTVIGVIPGNSNINANLVFRNWASRYFTDCPTLARKIEAREFKNKDVPEAIQFYIRQCGKS